MHRPRKSLGQNFLVDLNLQQKIVDQLEPDAEDDVLEIGSGTGALTRRIAGRVRRLVAVELDDALAASLEAELGGRDDVDILHRDILGVETADITAEPERLKVIGNIPYNITTPLIFRLLERARRPAVMVLMVQREVADRILAPPGTKAYGALSVGVRTVATAERLFDVGRTAFRPAPNVDSTVIRITPIRPPPLEPAEETELRTLTRVAFSRRRKQLQRILRSASQYGLAPAGIEALGRETGIELAARPEDLAPADFIALTRALRGHAAPSQPRADPAQLRLLGIVAHELRSPLTAIMGYQELLRDGFYGRLEEAAVEPVRRIGNSARQLLSLIDGLEQLVSRPAATDGSHQSDRPSADSSATLEQCLADAKREATACNIQLDIRSPETIERPHDDMDRACSTLELVFHAALKLARADALRLTIEQDDHRTSITVSGSGLDRYNLPAAPADAHAEIGIDSGAALRLAIARRVAASLRGRLFSRDAGDAATLVIELPRPDSRDNRNGGASASESEG